MESGTYPQEVTEDELDLGFRLRVFVGLWEYRHFPDGKVISPAVVAMILSSSEILVKVCDPHGSIYFTHQRYGRHKSGASITEAAWHPASGPYKDAAMFLQQYGVGLERLAADAFGPAFIPADFIFHDA
jgi:hypothetical protein